MSNIDAFYTVYTIITHWLNNKLVRTRQTPINQHVTQINF